MDVSKTMEGAPRQGFTLLELLVALSILAVGLLAVASMQVESMKGNTFSDLLTIANTLAEAKIEQLMGLVHSHEDLQDNNIANNDHLLSTTDTDGHQEIGLNRQGRAGSGIFTRIWNVAKRDATDSAKIGYPADGLMTVVVIVQWSDQGGRHQVYASSIRECPGDCPQP